ncbi:Protein kish [Tolypocladium paradoxum]|uniref:Protein kish n=1 Tax=Tolypocladium paradoxum TaxID=94208 RepID=A0A2S4L6S8_9HYPO|nr:Protein kish [Tolypocladium paradoxum]
MSALFNFQSLLLVLLLLICTSAYVHNFTPGIMDRNKNGYGPSVGTWVSRGRNERKLTWNQRHGHFLEMRADRRTTEPVHQHMLCRHGRLDSRQLDDSIR